MPAPLSSFLYAAKSSPNANRFWIENNEVNNHPKKVSNRFTHKIGNNAKHNQTAMQEFARALKEEFDSQIIDSAFKSSSVINRWQKGYSLRSEDIKKVYLHAHATNYHKQISKDSEIALALSQQVFSTSIVQSNIAIQNNSNNNSNASNEAVTTPSEEAKNNTEIIQQKISSNRKSKAKKAISANRNSNQEIDVSVSIKPNANTNIKGSQNNIHSQSTLQTRILDIQQIDNEMNFKDLERERRTYGRIYTNAQVPANLFNAFSNTCELFPVPANDSTKGGQRLATLYSLEDARGDINTLKRIRRPDNALNSMREVLENNGINGRDQAKVLREQSAKSYEQLQEEVNSGAADPITEAIYDVAYQQNGRMRLYGNCKELAYDTSIQLEVVNIPHATVRFTNTNASENANVDASERDQADFMDHGFIIAAPRSHPELINNLPGVNDSDWKSSIVPGMTIIDPWAGYIFSITDQNKEQAISLIEDTLQKTNVTGAERPNSQLVVESSHCVSIDED